ncbi:Location of vulva defective 1 like [Quillaja saponaria]|uniref:Location of vulva defective 1 like n=1 Tax=Quillaja saponaria TaxID=32244 RepID=A0AAD7PZK4_QUISA|nr:Location of vulva defective 1 like [Quillaja saponaria]
MGQSLMKFAPGNEEKKGKEIGPIIEKCFDKYLADSSKDLTLADFCGAVCSTIEEINVKLGNTQFRIPSTSALRMAYDRHHQGRRRSLTKEEFQKILQEVITDTGFTGLGGAKDTLLYIFGVPLAALFIKQKVMPRAVPNEIFIPGITSVTVFILGKLNKI